MGIYNGTADNFGTAIAKWRQMLHLKRLSTFRKSKTEIKSGLT